MTHQILVNHNSPNYISYDHSKQESDWETEDDGFDPFYASKFCETILEEFQNGDLDSDLEELRNFIKIAPKPENMKTLTAYLINLRKKSQLLHHAKSKPKKNYPCGRCDKVFGWPTDLKRHVLIHTGVRPFSCEHCASSFNRSWLLRKHVSRLHPNQASKKIERKAGLHPVG